MVLPHTNTVWHIYPLDGGREVRLCLPRDLTREDVELLTRFLQIHVDAIGLAARRHAQELALIDQLERDRLAL